MAQAQVNEIIQAMIAQKKMAQEGGQEANRVAIEREKLKQDKEYKDQLLKESQQKIEDSHQQHQDLLDLKHQMAQSALEKSRSDLYAGTAKAVKEAPQGINPETQKPYAQEALENYARFHQGKINPAQPAAPAAPDAQYGVPQPQTQAIPGNVEFPNEGITGITAGGFPTGESVATQKGSEAGAVADAKLPAALKAIQDKLSQQHQNDLDRDNERAKAGLTLQAAKGVSAERLANIGGQYRQSVANINQNGHLNAIKLGLDMGMDEDSAGIMAEHGRKLTQGILDGQTDFTKLQKPDKLAAMHYALANNIELPTDSKTYKEHLDSLGQIQELANQARDLAKQYSIDAPKGGPLQLLQKGQGGIIPTSDLNAALDQFNTHAGELAVSNNNSKRINEAEMARQMKGLINPRRTTAQNMQAIDDFEKSQGPKVQGIFTGIPDDERNRILGTRGVTIGADPQTGQPVPQGTRPSAIPQAPAPPKIERHPLNPAYIKNPATGKYALDPTYHPQSPTAQPVPGNMQQ